MIFGVVIEDIQCNKVTMKVIKEISGCVHIFQIKLVHKLCNKMSLIFGSTSNFVNFNGGVGVPHELCVSAEGQEFPRGLGGDVHCTHGDVSAVAQCLGVHDDGLMEGDGLEVAYAKLQTDTWRPCACGHKPDGWHWIHQGRCDPTVEEALHVQHVLRDLQLTLALAFSTRQHLGPFKHTFKSFFSSSYLHHFSQHINWKLAKLRLRHLGYFSSVVLFQFQYLWIKD